MTQPAPAPSSVPPDAAAPNEAAGQFARYVVVGLTAVAVHFVLMTILVEAFAVAKGLASFAGFVLGSCVNYTLQHAWVFKAERSHAAAAPTYVVVTSIGAVLNFVVLHAGMTVIDWMTFLPEIVRRFDYQPAQAAAIGVVFLFNFWANRRFTFAAAQSAAQQESAP